MTMLRVKSISVCSLVLCLLILFVNPTVISESHKSLKAPFTITQITTCLKINPITYLPDEPTDTFLDSTETIYLTLSFKNAEPESILKVEWIDVAQNKTIGDFTIKVSGSDNAHFYITKPSETWHIGAYKVLIYYNGTLKKEVPFQIYSAQPTIATSESDNSFRMNVIREYTLAKEIDPQTYRPIDPTNRFVPNQPYLYLSIRTQEAPANSQLQIEWYYVGIETFIFADQELEISGSDTAYFSLSKPDVGWPIGLYKVTIYFNGQLFDTIPFQIVEATPYDYITSVCMTYDVEDDSFLPIDVTYLFFPSDPEIHVLLDFEDVPSETPFEVCWYYYEDGTRYRVAETPTTGSGDDTIDFWVEAPDGGFWLGEYEAEVYIDGELYTVIPFKVIEM